MPRDPELDLDSISRWIQLLKAGDDRAPEAIWQGFFSRLVEFARRKLQNLPRVARDEEDIALSALNSVFRGAREARFPKLNDRDDLWKLLFVIAARKAKDYGIHVRSAKRPDMHIARQSDGDDAQLLLGMFGSEPGPELVAIFAEEYQRRIDVLPDNTFRQIVARKLEGFTNREIAMKLGTHESNIERKLSVVRSLWSNVEHG